jgi:hypothetical protein
VGHTPIVVEVPANVPAPGLPAKSKTENGMVATVVLVAVFNILTRCFAEAIYASKLVIGMAYAISPISTL